MTRSIARDAVLGILVADALGVPHEFKTADQLPPIHEIELVMPAQYRKTYAHVPYGTWSDDGSQMLCLLDSLTRHQGHLDENDFGQQLIRWHDDAWHQAGGVVFDVGGQTSVALDHLRRGGRIGVTERGQGNGSLMRVLPAALLPVLWGRSGEDAVEAAMRQSKLTHPHPVPVVCCGVYVQLALLLLEDPRQPLKEAMRHALDLVSRHPMLSEPGMRDAPDWIRRFGTREMQTGSGFVLDTLWSSLASLDQGTDYLSAVRAAISLGNDTDTTAAVTGGLAAIRYGLESLPPEWLEALITPPESTELLRRTFG